jgi:4-amino-4-deoxy-L-arabinose transferase-like glycosyltransferase
MAVLGCFAASLAFLLITHWPYLDLPYHWDELGYFIPAAHDLLNSGALVPRSTLPNVHPPLVMLYLAGVWKLFGFSIPVTRVAMLAIGAATLTAAFVLARRLSGTRAALMAVGLLAVSPPFVAQSMLAHLDLPATLGVLMTLYFFVERRWRACGLAATALVLTKETGIIVPALLLVLGRAERGRLLPLGWPFVALGAWLVLLHAQTGHWLGSAEFERYNVTQALSPGRAVLVLVRRLYQLGAANFHWVGTIVLLFAWRRGGIRGPNWRAAGAIIAGYVFLHSVLGGAILLRYLLPAVALLYIATGAALERFRPGERAAAYGLLLGGLAVSNWWNPPYPFGYEDNLAVVDFVRLQEQAARWLSENARSQTITTAWPLTDALSNPLLGYVQRPLQVQALENFQPASWEHLDADSLKVVALYARSWDPPRGWQRWPPAQRLLQRYFSYEPPLTRGELLTRYELRTAARWERRGQWIEIFVTSAAPVRWVQIDSPP